MTKLRPKLSIMALLYLSLPNLLFFLFWLKWWLGVPMFALAVLLLIKLGRRTFVEPCVLFVNSSLRSSSNLFVAIGLGVLWSVFAGYFGVIFGWTPDWNDVRADFVSTFSVLDWPVGIETTDGSGLLVAQLGLYLVPAFLFKMSFQQNLVIAQLLVAVYITIGLALVLCFVIEVCNRTFQKVTAALIFLTFGGLDVLGILGRQDDPWSYIFTGGHLEPWDGMLQLSNVTTLIFWVPHHALASWLGVVVILGHRNRHDFMLATTLVCSMTLLWSPFAVIGLIVVGCICFVVDRAWTSRIGSGDWPFLFAAVALSAPVAKFYSLVDSLEVWWFFSPAARENAGLGYISAGRQGVRFVFFWSIEVGLWLFLARILGFSLRMHHYLAFLSMIALSLFSSYGPNDFMMRSVIAPHFLLLMPLLIQASEYLVRPSPRRILGKATLILVILATSATSVVEVVENYNRGPRRLQAPCLVSGCRSNITDPTNVDWIASSGTFIFRDHDVRVGSRP